ncbi:hypothetical protein ACSYAD_30260 [Acaryochloris marina NIES-2412]|uniref:hypothetical protein n=1 Tax=Acaryochloris marina TaxID=155978 RepID=UPI0040581DC5
MVQIILRFPQRSNIPPVRLIELGVEKLEESQPLEKLPLPKPGVGNLRQVHILTFFSPLWRTTFV